MASCRVCDLRTLLAIVCGLITTIILGLGIWRAVVRIQKGTPDPTPSIPTGFCRNNGTWGNGRCTCPEKWKGLRCTIANFCGNSTSGNLTFDEITVGRYGPSLQTCDKNTPNVGKPRATRLCNLTEDGVIKLQEPILGNCSLNLETLEQEIGTSMNFSTISQEAQILTSNASALTLSNLTSATKVVGQIFNESRNASSEAKIVAVTTVSQLLEARENLFQKAAAADDNAFETLIKEMENYSWSLGNKTVLNPNIAVQSVILPSGDTGESTGVRFTVQKGSSNSLVSGSTHVETNVDSINPDPMTELQIFLNTSKVNARSCGFVVYQNSKLFQSKLFTPTSSISQKIISGKTNSAGNDQSASVKMVFHPQYDKKEYELNSFACVYWNFSKNDWDTNGCSKVGENNGFLHCHCNHTTNFAVLMSLKKNYNYPKPLDELSTFGCALSITGLALTIIFQIVTRKVRKTSVTWVLVSLCTSMLIFNLLFVFGIENSNGKSKTSDTNDTNSKENTIPTRGILKVSNLRCTVIAALLHYFLLVTFTWTGLSAAQLYFLLIRTMKPLPQRFILYILLIGWGVPAVVVTMTVGIIFSQNPSQWELNYRQEEICWLAIPENKDFIKSPLLWSFILPVTVILISNVVIFIIITVRVLWKNDQNLTSTKKISSLKKVFSSLSIAAVFGITWLLGYFMLIDNDKIRIIFSYIFCLFNTTQGLQIFILHTVRTKIFQNKASEVLKSLSSSTGRMTFRRPSASLGLRVKMYNMLRSWPALNERFRLLEPFVMTKEMTLSESDQENESI
ncbi:adhesion G-protein coupled receptor G7 [Molossus molossus]|uniref:Adhesion G-protein coupled receptor G7 n=1 Tax=Molossus molossus TaxID=27622 RepID=A0A7J8HXG0_MOLMO|nr:adhesion G-protein coupled receptor G7 [Molossus molossus]KAF6477076.1 adhesion G protein-coupled receptor G7 [Molossus molossus]